MTYQPNIDMSQLFEFDKDDQWTLKALPYVVDWFRRAEYASFYELGKSVETKKLSAIFQFARSSQFYLYLYLISKTERGREMILC